MRAGPRARRRTALAGLGMAGVAGTAAACSLLPGGADEEPSDDTGARDGDGASDGGDGAAEPTPEPGTTFEDWATADDLSPTEIDIAAADERTGLGPGQVEREDRFGTWFSPGFPEDSPVFTAEPLEMDPAAVEALGGKSEAHDALLSVLVATIVDIADTPLLLEADNTRSGEVAPVLLEALGLGGFDPEDFAPMFEEAPLSGSPVPGEGVPEVFDFEPAPYPEDGPRMSVLESSTTLTRMPAGAPFTAEGAALSASVRGVVPIEREGEEGYLRREVSFLVGLEDGGRNALLSYAVSTGPAVAIAEPDELPRIEPTEVPGDWQQISLGRLSAMIPPGLGGVEEVELTTQVRDEDGAPVASITRHRLPVASPYLLGPVRHVARVEVDGADLVTAEVNAGGDAGLLLTMRVHLGEDQYHVQLTGLTEEDAPVIAHQVLAGLRVKG